MRVTSLSARVLGPLALLALAQGCIFNNVSTEETLRDAVVGLNDEVRWNRMDLATQRVAPKYRNAFSLTHHDWHEGMQIADSEIVHVQVGEERDEAKAFITIRWYDQATMLVAETTLEQKWEKVGRAFVLVAEAVRDGDPRLIELPEGMTFDEDGAVVPDEEDSAENDEDSSDDSGRAAVGAAAAEAAAG